MLWKNISDCIDKVVDIIGSVAVLVTILSTSFNIFSRWFVGRSFGQLDEISLIAFVWTIYIGMGVLYNKNEHICMDFILNKLPRVPKLILTLIDMLIELGISVLVTVLAIKLMSRSFIRTTNVIHLPYAYLQLSIAIGFGLLAAVLIAKIIGIIVALVQKEDPFETPCIEEGGKD